MKKRTGRRILSGVLLLMVAGSFLFSSILGVMAFEKEQTEAAGTEISQTDLPEDETEPADVETEFVQTEEEDANRGGGSADAEAESPGAGGGSADTETESPGAGGGSADAETESSGAESVLADMETESPEAEQISADTYILYITHILLYTEDGKEKNMQDYSQVQLEEADFEDGAYSLMKQAYDWEAATAVPGPDCPEKILVEDFRENGEGQKEYYAEIRYTVREGWEVRFSQADRSDGIMLFSLYEGAFDNIEFVPAKSITLTINYKYSDTGGLAGINAHAPDVITLPLGEDGTADLENWRVPHYENGNYANLQGFRTVLDPAPLNAFLVNPDSKDPNALENGDFNLKPDVDITSPEYQGAWDAARKITVGGVTFTYIAPAENGGTAATTSQDPDKQYTLNASGLTKDLSLTIYYRRAMGTYTVKYWKVGANEDGSDEEITRMEKLSGRIGALTNAQPLKESESPTGYSLEDIVQKPIAPDGSTVVDVYYSSGRIRVIFDTDYIYIPRQQVAVGGNVDFSGIKEDEMNAARAGYRFAGWQYQNKSGKLTDLDVENNKFRLTSDFLAGANITGSQESDDASIQVLNLYPKWEKASTTVRVTFWTEDLNGQDVSAADFYYDFGTSSGRQINRTGYQAIVHENYTDTNASYTNAGSFTIDVQTGEALADKSGNPVPAIQAEIDGQLSQIMGQLNITSSSASRTVSLADFYEQQGVTVAGGEGENSLAAAADGGTQIYVFFARREYMLDFVYYFLPEHSGGGNPTICTVTDGFSNEHWSTYPNVNGISNITLEDAPLGTGDNRELFRDTVPQHTLITAKYGADLRNVWPGAEPIDSPGSTRYVLNNGSRLRISWATTIGIHNAIRPGGNVNVPGAYSTMSAEIVADTGNNKTVHHLVAFWKGTTNNTYRYNYCYEVPDLDASEVMTNSPEISILQGASNTAYDNLSEEERKIRNTLYLVPVTEAAFVKYGFSDLITYDELALTEKEEKIPASLDKGVAYYVIRIYNGKCYAVSRQLVAISALAINSQNPSAQPNLTLVNTSQQDYSTELLPSDGAGNGGYDNINRPYDIYFYYTRERFTITYMSNGTTEIGKITLPYGARLYGSRYNIPLEYTKQAGYYASEQNGYAAWSTVVQNVSGTAVNSTSFPVCPGRSENGTRAWKFGGWYLEPFGSRPVEWEDNSRTPVVLEGNLRLYAKWEAPNYTVIFDWNGGSLSSSGGTGSEAQIKEQSLPANQSFVKNGQIPRPVRNGYILYGWQITHRGQVDGGVIQWISETATGGMLPEFHFDEPITSDLQVQAVWTPSGVADISYTVSYLEMGSGKAVAADKKVTGTYRAGTVVWERPAVPNNGPYRNYVPLEQNKSITLDTVNENRLVFYYVAPSDYPYQVKFVEQDTKQEILVYDSTTKSAALLVYPGQKQVGELDELGYWVVDDNGNPEENGAKLAKSIRPGADPNPAAIFYVLPKEYEIWYTNLGVMGEEAEKELRAINPTSYTTKSPAITLVNPQETYSVDGRESIFLGWSLEQTLEIGTVTGETPDFGDQNIAASVTIQPGSRGRLIFRAVWSSDSYVVYFYPGDRGVFLPNEEPFIDFGGLAPNTLLADKITVPAVTPNEDDAFIGWQWKEGKDLSRLYTEEEILAMSIQYQDLHFIARYQSEQKDGPRDPVVPGAPGGEESYSLREASSPGGEKGHGGGGVSSPGGLDAPRGAVLPRTGMRWILVLVLGILGILLLILGIRMEQKQGEAIIKNEPLERK